MTYLGLFLLLGASIVPVNAHGNGKCGTLPPEPVTAGMEELRLRHFKENHSGRRKLQYESCHELCKACIEIPVAFHLTGVADVDAIPRIPHPTFVADEYFFGDPASITPSAWTTFDELTTLVDEQMIVLNDSFADTPFYFTLQSAGPDVAVNNDWTRFPSDYGQDMSAALGVPDLTVLNVFLCYSAQSMSDYGFSITIGFATLPGWQFEGLGDGIYLRYDALPGGGFSGSDYGFTLVHEVGHWLGLYHVFQSWVFDETCSPADANDFVEDTPQMNGSSDTYFCADVLAGSQPLADTCPDLSGLDPFFNYMNYINDEACYQNDVGSFSCGQIERMYLHYLLYRENEEICSGQETEIAITVQITTDIIPGYADDDPAAYDDPNAEDDIAFFSWASWYLVDENNKVVYDSTRDYLPLFIVFDFQDTHFVDLCLPANLAYTFVYQDPNQLSENPVALIEVSKDGVVIERKEGPIGISYVIEIPASNKKDPSSKGTMMMNKTWKGYKGYNKGKGMAMKGYRWKDYKGEMMGKSTMKSKKTMKKSIFRMRPMNMHYYGAMMMATKKTWPMKHNKSTMTHYHRPQYNRGS